MQKKLFLSLMLLASGPVLASDCEGDGWCPLSERSMSTRAQESADSALAQAAGSRHSDEGSVVDRMGMLGVSATGLAAAEPCERAGEEHLSPIEQLKREITQLERALAEKRAELAEKLGDEERLERMASSSLTWVGPAGQRVNLE